MEKIKYVLTPIQFSFYSKKKKSGKSVKIFFFEKTFSAILISKTGFVERERHSHIACFCYSLASLADDDDGAKNGSILEGKFPITKNLQCK